MASLKVATFNVCIDANKKGKGPTKHTFENLMAVKQKKLKGQLVDLTGSSYHHKPLSKAYAFSLFELKNENADVICLQECTGGKEAREAVEIILSKWKLVAYSDNSTRASMVFVRKSGIKSFANLNESRELERIFEKKNRPLAYTFSTLSTGRMIALAHVVWNNGKESLIASAHSEHRRNWNNAVFFNQCMDVIKDYAEKQKGASWDFVIFAGDLNTYNRYKMGSDKGYKMGTRAMHMPIEGPGPETTVEGPHASDHLFSTLKWDPSTDHCRKAASDHYIRICTTASELDVRCVAFDFDGVISRVGSHFEANQSRLCQDGYTNTLTSTNFKLSDDALTYAQKLKEQKIPYLIVTDNFESIVKHVLTHVQAAQAALAHAVFEGVKIIDYSMIWKQKCRKNFKLRVAMEDLKIESPGQVLLIDDNKDNVQAWLECGGSAALVEDCKIGYTNAATPKRLSTMFQTEKLPQSRNWKEHLANIKTLQLGDAPRPPLKAPELQILYDIDIVRHGDIFKDPDHTAVVNAANGGLRHNSGIAGEFRKVGEADLQKVDQTLLKNRGKKLRTGEAALVAPAEGETRIGKISVKYVIHAVGPNFTADKYGGNSEKIKAGKEKLKDAYRNALAEAQKNDEVQNVVFCFLSSGIFLQGGKGIKLEDVVQIALDTLMDPQSYIDKPTIKNVAIVAYKGKIKEVVEEMTNGRPAAQRKNPADATDWVTSLKVERPSYIKAFKAIYEDEARFNKFKLWLQKSQRWDQEKRGKVGHWIWYVYPTAKDFCGNELNIKNTKRIRSYTHETTEELDRFRYTNARYKEIWQMVNFDESGERPIEWFKEEDENRLKVCRTELFPAGVVAEAVNDFARRSGLEPIRALTGNDMESLFDFIGKDTRIEKELPRDTAMDTQELLQSVYKPLSALKEKSLEKGRPFWKHESNVLKRWMEKSKLLVSAAKRPQVSADGVIDQVNRLKILKPGVLKPDNVQSLLHFLWSRDVESKDAPDKFDFDQWLARGDTGLIQSWYDLVCFPLFRWKRTETLGKLSVRVNKKDTVVVLIGAREEDIDQTENLVNMLRLNGVPRDDRHVYVVAQHEDNPFLTKTKEVQHECYKKMSVVFVQGQTLKEIMTNASKATKQGTGERADVVICNGAVPQLFQENIKYHGVVYGRALQNAERPNMFFERIPWTRGNMWLFSEKKVYCTEDGLPRFQNLRYVKKAGNVVTVHFDYLYGTHDDLDHNCNIEGRITDDGSRIKFRYNEKLTPNDTESSPNGWYVTVDWNVNTDSIECDHYRREDLREHWKLTPCTGKAADAANQGAEPVETPKLGNREAIQLSKLWFSKMGSFKGNPPEATMDDLKRISCRGKESFTEEEIFNFDVYYDDKKCKLKKVLGTGGFGTVVSYECETERGSVLIALKAERPDEIFGASLPIIKLDVMDGRCSLQSPVLEKFIEKEHGKRDPDFNIQAWIPKRKKFEDRYNKLYVMPQQTGDCFPWFRNMCLLFEKLKPVLNSEQKEEFRVNLKSLFKDLTKQIFCALREQIFIHDIKENNYLYRRLDENHVCVMLSDFGMWRSSSTQSIFYRQSYDYYDKGGTPSYGLIEIFKAIDEVSQIHFWDDAQQKHLRRDKLEQHFEVKEKEENEKAAKRLADLIGKANPIEPKTDRKDEELRYIKLYPRVAYFFMYIMDTFKSEVALNEYGRIQFAKTEAQSQFVHAAAAYTDVSDMDRDGLKKIVATFFQKQLQDISVDGGVSTRDLLYTSEIGRVNFVSESNIVEILYFITGPRGPRNEYTDHLKELDVVDKQLRYLSNIIENETDAETLAQFPMKWSTEGSKVVAKMLRRTEIDRKKWEFIQKYLDSLGTEMNYNFLYGPILLKVYDVEMGTNSDEKWYGGTEFGGLLDQMALKELMGEKWVRLVEDVQIVAVPFTDTLKKTYFEKGTKTDLETAVQYLIAPAHATQIVSAYRQAAKAPKLRALFLRATSTFAEDKTYNAFLTKDVVGESEVPERIAMDIVGHYIVSKEAYTLGRAYQAYDVTREAFLEELARQVVWHGRYDYVVVLPDTPRTEGYELNAARLKHICNIAGSAQGYTVQPTLLYKDDSLTTNLALNDFKKNGFEVVEQPAGLTLLQLPHLQFVDHAQ